MIFMQGRGVSRGVTSGPLYFFRRSTGEITRDTVEDSAHERARLERAQAQAVEQLNALGASCRAAFGGEAAALFETHAMLVEDEDYVNCILSTLEAEHCSAEYAVQQAGKQFAAVFAAMEGDYMQARAADMKDVTRRILNNLMGIVEGGIDSEEPVILAADDLAPSELLRLDRRKLRGFLTQGGSGNSHTAILARTMGIPAVCGLGDALRQGYEGRTAYMDGETGRVCLEPDEPTLQSYRETPTKQEQMQAIDVQEAVTLDGRHIELYCNIGAPEEVSAVLANGGQGIGLFRSEFLYLAASGYPTEEEQFQAYRSVAAAMDGRQVIIRTLDIGADKQADYFHLPKEENPALGLRAIRICLNRPEVFRTQLRALYRASAYGKVGILFPMITSVWEVQACKRACKSVMAELTEEGIPFDPATELGIMIETPASVFMARDLAKLVDFFSVGTNDLTQYTLACDRQRNDLDRFFDPHHPAILRALKMAADAAHGEGIRIGVCGELAADLSLLPAFLAVGIDALSVPPSSVPPLRAAIRRSVARACTPETYIP